jgi:hypothetical protein
MKSSAMIVAISCAVLVGCAAPEPYTMKSKLDHTSMQTYLQEGKAKVTGQAFLKTRGGDVKYGAGTTVSLYPDVEYATEYNNIPWFVNTVKGRDLEWSKYIKNTTSDGNGNFEFNGIPQGKYYLETSVTWEVPGRYGSETQGGIIRNSITVPNEGVIKIILTR